jgi:predicted nuclease of restriction endonuclease-like (RecB) superfamily
VSAKFQNIIPHDFALPVSTSEEIRRTASAKSETEMDLAPELLVSRLSYSHFLELLRVGDPLERLFYEVEAIKNCWDVRDLERAIDTSLFFRTGMSIDKEAVIAKIKNLKPTNNADVIRNPLILDFLGLREKSEYSESDLEQAILNNLQQFLMELGKGFCFESRQKRITFDNTQLLHRPGVLPSHFEVPCSDRP